MEMVLLSCIAVIAFRSRRLHAGNDQPGAYERALFRPFTHIGIILVTITATVLLILKLHVSFGYVLAITSLPGLMYGCFITLTRSYASERGSSRNGALLTVYNNLQNIASVAGYCVLFACSAIAPLVGIHYLRLVLFANCTVLLAAGSCAAIWLISWSREHTAGKMNTTIDAAPAEKK
jgi:hypothetical protein